MSSFFTLPASQKKRKRIQPSSEKQSVKRSKAQETRDESISGSDDEEDDAPKDRSDEFAGSESDDEEQFAGEDPAAKRIRLAEQYLANTHREVLDEVGFDAKDVDAENLRRRMGDRLKEDTAEGRGKLYRWIAEEADWSGATKRTAKVDRGNKNITGVAIQGQYMYAVSKEMVLTKWELPLLRSSKDEGKHTERGRSTPKRLLFVRGDRRQRENRDYQGHDRQILCIAASQDGKFVATGGADNKLIVWDAATLKPLKVFFQHRDSVISLAFRRGTNQLFSASKDRTVKMWHCDELAYVETLFGHQDEVVDISALAQEKCVTVGARDRTARLWKVVEESQLVFRGGGAPSKPRDTDTLHVGKAYNEGSMDRVACIDDETFITGSDNGSLSIWNIHKKKPVFTYPLAHGLEPAAPIDSLSAEEVPDREYVFQEPQPRWITSLRAIPFSDTFVSGSWDGYVRAWRLTPDKRRIEALGPIGRLGAPQHLRLASVEPKVNGEPGQSANVADTSSSGLLRGFINDLSIIDRGVRGKEGFLVAAAVGKESRLGSWKRIPDGKTGVVLFEVSKRILNDNSVEEAEEEKENGDGEMENGFAGF
nr:putative wd repeat-containing protein c2e1p5.05 [Quercus suber]